MRARQVGTVLLVLGGVGVLAAIGMLFAAIWVPSWQWLVTAVVVAILSVAVCATGSELDGS